MSKREIKFRAWIEHENLMVTEKYLVFWAGCVYYNESGTLIDPDKPCEPATLKGYSILSQNVMQFTGLLDRQGKEIYESELIALPTMDKKGKPAK